MTEFVAFPSGESGTVLIEVVEIGGGPVTRGRAGIGDMVVQAGESLDNVLGRIGQVVQGIVRQLPASADWPDHVVIEFAVKISADSNVIVARAGGEANFKVSVKWTKPKAE